MEFLWQDVRFGLRMLRKSPGFTAVAILTLALGIGANTAIFSLADAFLFRPLAVKDADRLTVMAMQVREAGGLDQLSYPDFLDYKQQSTVFTEMTGFVLDLAGIGDKGRAERVILSYVPSNYFTMLGLHPTVGRLIAPGEGDAPGSAPVVVLGYSYWQRRFGGDAGVVGRSVNLDGQEVTVIGVMQKDYLGAFAVVEMDAYAPIGMITAGSKSPAFFTSRDHGNVRVLATLRPGVTPKQAEASLNVIAQRLAQQYPLTDQGKIPRVVPERMARPEPSVADSITLVAGVFLLLVGLVLLVACVNVANLLLARAASREKEIAIRAAMGAGRLRLIRQLLTESLLLALGGGVGGALLGMWVCHALEGLRPLGDFPIRFGNTFDWRVFTYVAAVALAAGIFAGLAPAMRVRKTNLNTTLREGGRGMIGDSARHLLRNSLVAAQVAGSLVVLVAAGLFARSLGHAKSIDLGFDAHNLLNVGINPGMEGYDQPRAEALLREVLRRGKALPGVESASLAYSIPLDYYGDGASIFVEGQSSAPAGRTPGAGLNSVSPEYFSTMRMRLLKGRSFTDSDTSSSLAVAIVNEEMAKRLWPGQDVLGRRFSFKEAAGPKVTIVGVVGNVLYSGITEPPGPFFYLPETQNYRDVHVLQLRTSVPPESLIPAIEAQIRELDPNLPLFDVMSMDRSLTGANGFFLFNMGAAFAGALGGLGLLLAVVGVYGVVSYTASRRTHEIGVRMALGAHPLSILGLVLRQAVYLVGTGVGAGLIAALGVTRLLSSLLVNVKSYDPVTFASVSGLLVAVALGACYLPAHRATRVDPSIALRYE